MVADGTVDGPVDAVELVGEAEGCVSAGEEEQPATKRPRQLTAKSLLVPLAVLPNDYPASDTSSGSTSLDSCVIRAALSSARSAIPSFL